jgi:uncharacterized protein YegJ (DUF2314 family)
VIAREHGGWALAVALALVAALPSCGKRASQLEPSAAASSKPPLDLSADPELAHAERNAIAKLSDFRKVLESAQPGTTYFEVQAVVRDGALSERLWLNDVHAVAGGFEGASNAPAKFVKSIQQGQRVQVANEDIVDWSYYDRGKVQGGETRVVLARQKRNAELNDALKHCPEAHYADGCAALGDNYATGRIGERQLDVAYKLYVAACSGGSAYGCNAAGWATLHGRGGQQDLAAAAKYFERACSTGDEHSFGCDSRGFALLSGLAGTKRDVASGLRLLEKTCARGLAPSCLLLELATAKKLRRGPKLELACQVTLSEQASRCTGERDPQACFLAGTAIEVGACGAPRSAPRSAPLLRIAAEFGATWPGVTL